MANDRLSLHEILTSILGTTNVYYQPPTNLQLRYPCIIYSLSDVYDAFANDARYISKTNYLITMVTNDPDDETWRNILSLKYAKLQSSFVAENLNHYVISLFY